MHRVIVALAVLSLPFASARADMGPIPGEERFEGLLPENKQSVGAQLGFAQMSEDFYLQLVVKSELNLGSVGIGFQVPLNLRVWDKDPQATDDYYGVIRREDWDEKSEWVRVIRYVRLGHKRDSYYLRVGELAAELGHGTIMNRYINNLDIDTFRVGTAFDVNTSYGGVETVISDLGTLYDTASPESRIVGARVYLKPFALVDAESSLNIFSIGASLVSDTNAPRVIATDTISNPPSPPTTRPRVDENGNLEVATDTAATVWGLDAEVEVLHNVLLDLVPYTDVNFIQQAGWGWHVGVLATFKMPVGFALTVPIRVEYRRFKSNYVPQYFNTFYEIERYSYLKVADPVTNPNPGPKAAEVRALSAGEGLNGYYGDFAFDFAGLIQVGAVYEDYKGGNPNLAAFAAVPALEWLQFKAYYSRTGITGTDDIVKFDDRSFAVAEGRYELISYVYLVGRATRRWQLVTDPADDHYGEFEGKTDWKFGVEANLEF